MHQGTATHPLPGELDANTVDIDALLPPDMLPTFSVASFVAKGSVLEGAALQHPGPLALVELQDGDAPSRFVVGTENFYAITRYNWSSYYALAPIELGKEVARALYKQAARNRGNIGLSLQAVTRMIARFCQVNFLKFR